MKRIVYFFTIIVAFLSCSEEDTLPPNNNDVSIKTISHSLNNDGGVTLVGKISNVKVPIDYGFLISTEEEGTYNNDYASKKKLDVGIFNGEFSQDFKSDLYQGTTYYYNTIALKNGEYILGKEKKFISNGSATPQIKSVFPNRAHLGDTITINGLYFSQRSAVFFNEVKSRLLISNDTLIKCIVTNNSEINKEKLPNLELKITNSTQNETYYKDFSLYTPRIDSVRPYKVFLLDTITIHGDHFSTGTTGNRLYLKDENGYASYYRILKESRTELVFIMGNTAAYEPDIQLESQHQTILAENKFKLALPKITGVSKNILKYGEKLTVYGSNFPNTNHYSSDFLEYKIGKGSMPFLEIYRDSLILEVNDSYHNLDFIMDGISVTLSGHKVNLKQDFLLDENYVRVSFNQGTLYASGTVGEDLYAMEYSYYPSDKRLVKFNKQTNYFDNVSPDATDSKAASSNSLKFHGSKIYSLNLVAGKVAFFSYDVLTHTETKLADFPGTLRVNPLMEVVGNYLYVGLGGYSSITKNYNDMWKYSLADNTWKFVLDFPKIDAGSFPKFTSVNFTLGTKIYVGGRQRISGDESVDFWEFDTQTNTVVRKSDLLITIPYKTESIVIKNKGFFDYNGLTYIYNPENNEWTSKQTGMDINGQNSFFYETDEFVYSKNSNSVIKIKKSYFND